ncbi:hypothetical protein D3C86_1887080 [compost metagenome]
MQLAEVDALGKRGLEHRQDERGSLRVLDGGLVAAVELEEREIQEGHVSGGVRRDADRLCPEPPREKIGLEA